jgi:hypothetical protein
LRDGVALHTGGAARPRQHRAEQRAPDGAPRPGRARTAGPGDRDRLWAVMTAIWPDYDDYAKKTEREIPLVVISAQ